MPELSGKTIWLTGASSGIGEAFAKRLARIDCKLAISARRQEPLDAIVEESSRHGGTVASFPLDVTDRAAVAETHKRIVEKFGPVDILVCSAGTYKPTDPKEFSAEEYEQIMALNYMGTLNCVEVVLPSMIERKRGLLAPISSLVGYRGLPRSSSYGASKAALINFFEGLRFDLKKHGVKVTIINPGFVKTPLTDKNDFEMPFLVPAERAAEIMVDGIRKEKLEVHYPWQLSWIFKTLRVIPFPIYNYLIGKKVVR